MKTYKKRLIFILILLALPILVIRGEDILSKVLDYLDIKPIINRSAEESDFFVTAIDVGHGDSFLIKCLDESGSFHFALIDTGSFKYSDNVINFLKSEGVLRLDFILISHLHSDHMGSLSEILKKYDADEIFLPNYYKIKEKLIDYGKLKSVLNKKKLNIKNVRPLQKIPIGKASFDVIYPITDKKYKLPNDLNETSIVGILKYKKFRMMFTGDATMKVENKILNNYKAPDLKCDILKVAHHGSRTSSSRQFLKVVSPRYGIVSSGNESETIYPHPEVEKSFNLLGIKYYNTRLSGNIRVFLSGDDYVFLTDE